MNLKRCPNGHYYDADECGFCPKCESQGLTLPATDRQEAEVPQSETQEKPGPVAGWLACIEGEPYGCIYELKFGENRIGDSWDADIRLSGTPRLDGCCQAVVTYDQESRTFTVNIGESRELSYVNDQVILFDTELHQRDVIQIGGVRLMFIPLCGPDFSWKDEE